MKSIILFACLCAYAHARILPGMGAWEEWDHDTPIVPKRICFWGLRCCDGWQDLDNGCHTPVCSVPCKNGGTCVAPDTCECTPGLSGSTCTEYDEDEYCWTEWNSFDEPSTGLGDFETIIEHREQANICQGSNPIAIDCQTVGGITWLSGAQEVTCDLQTGFACYHSHQKSTTCELDYQVRFLCSCPSKSKEKDGELKYIPPTIVSTTTPKVENKTCFIGNTSISPGMNMTFGCRTCNCASDGTWLCSTISTCTNETYTPGVCKVNATTILLETDITTIDCNVCVCTKTNSMACTKMICPAKSDSLVAPNSSRCYDDDGQFYEEHTMQWKDCNVCICTQAKWDCTRLACSQDHFQVQLEQNVCTDISGKAYGHGSTLVKDCNAWTCYDGEWASTRRYCSPVTYPNSTCLDTNTSSILTNGQIIRRGCNVCVCNSGNLTCTSEKCPVETLGICLLDLHRFLFNNETDMKLYEPVCNSTNGLYQPMQCKNESCFCVDPFGQYIPNSYLSGKTPNCSDYIYNTTKPLITTKIKPMSQEPTFYKSGIPACLRQQEISRTMKNIYSPTCRANGTFEPLQCPKDNRTCFCVDVTGTVVVNTTSKFTSPPVCDMYNNVTLLRLNITTDSTFYGTLPADCGDNCTIIGTQVNTSLTQTLLSLNSTNITLSACAHQQIISSVVPGVFRPTCNANGTFSPLQCQPKSGVCYCVDTNGVQIKGTDTKVYKDILPTCEKYWNVTTNMTSDTIDFTSLLKLPKFNFTSLFNQTTLAKLNNSQWNMTLYTLMFNASQWNTSLYNETALSTMLNISMWNTTVFDSVFNASMWNETDFNGLFNVSHWNTTLYTVMFNSSLWNTTFFDTLFNVTQWNTTKSAWLFNMSLPNVADCNCTKYKPKTDLKDCFEMQRLASWNPDMVAPTCNPNNTYAALQCSSKTGYCYCSYLNGRDIPETATPIIEGTPSCWQYATVNVTNMTIAEEKMTNWTKENRKLANRAIIWNMTLNYLHQMNTTLMKLSMVNQTCFIGNMSIASGTNTTFGCRVCNCTDGVWKCVLNETCLLNETFTPGVCQVNSTTILLEQDITTVDCNVCICARNNSLVCTKMMCPAKMTTDVVLPMLCFDRNTSYEENVVLRRGCNVCVCTQGDWDCTDEVCPVVSSDKVCIDENGRNHPDGVTILKDCNAWTCIDGKWASTHRYCSPVTYPNSICLDTNTSTTLTNGQTVRRGCNVCVCNSGNLTCTSVECPTNSSGVCLDHLHRNLYANGTALWYKPMCNATNGLYQPVQCCNKNKMCFCVDPVGHYLPWIFVYNKTPNCSAYIYNVTRPKLNTEVVDTLQTRPSDVNWVNRTCRQMLMLSKLNPMVPRPSCLPDGSYMPIQCTAHMMCYCAHRNGTYINGTLTHISKGLPLCLKFRETQDVVLPESQTEMATKCNITKCMLMAKIARETMMPHVPTCDFNGTYTPRQCNTITGVCFCVDIMGSAVPGTIVSIADNSWVDCMQYRTQEWNAKLTHQRDFITSSIINDDKFPHGMPACERQKVFARDLKTVFMPTCESNGTYSPLQCPPDTDVCFCVDRTGSVIANTTTTSVNSSPEMCEMYRNVSLIPRNMTNTTIFNTFPDLCGSDCPKVGPQINSSLTYELPLNTTNNYTSCTRQMIISSLVPGVFRPTCLKNGSFSPLQCQPQSGVCYCVDTNGVPIQGTESKVSLNGLPNCSMYWNVTMNVKTNFTSFLIEEMHAMNEIDIETENFTALFNLTSLFNSSVAFNMSLWNATLFNITGFNTTLLDTDILSWLKKGDCFAKQRLASRMGMFVPICEPDNTYSALQCSRDTGICFCSLPNGRPLYPTVTPIIEGTPSCWQYATVNVTNVTLEGLAKARRAIANWTATLNTTRSLESTKVPDIQSTKVPDIQVPSKQSYDPLYCAKVGSFVVFCYCTRPSGMEVIGTRQYFGMPDCSSYPDMCMSLGKYYNPGEKVIKKQTIIGCQACTCSAGSWMCEYKRNCDEDTSQLPPVLSTKATPTTEMVYKRPTTTLEPHSCEHEGTVYKSGQVHSWDCRTCTCVNYRWVCSTRDCTTTTIAPTNVPVVTTIGYRDCTIGDEVFRHLSAFDIGCTECTCTDGEAICSSRNCQ